MSIYIFLLVILFIVILIPLFIWIIVRNFLSAFQKLTESNISKTISLAHEQLLNVNYNKLQEVANLNSTKLAEVSSSNTKKLHEVLFPFNKDLIEFKQRIEDISIFQAKQVGELSGKLDGMVQLHNKLSEETNNLTKALRGQIKLQGWWGEEILKKVLESSGLKKDTNYIEQASYDTENGRKRPDYIIRLPENRDIIIDAKLSLNSYVEYYKADNAIDKQHFLNAMKDAFKKHIDTLASKEYYKISDIKSVKAVLIFIPIESIFLILVDNFQSLLLEAAKRNVYVTTTTSLMPLLQVIENMWKTHYQNKNALEMARVASKIYDKFYGILEDFDKMRSCIVKADKQLDEMEVKFKGKDSFVRNVEKLKELGAYTSKQISDKWLSSCEENSLELTQPENSYIDKESKIE